MGDKDKARPTWSGPCAKVMNKLSQRKQHRYPKAFFESVDDSQPQSPPGSEAGAAAPAKKLPADGGRDKFLAENNARSDKLKQNLGKSLIDFLDPAEHEIPRNRIPFTN